jgi:signal peptidase I
MLTFLNRCPNLGYKINTYLGFEMSNIKIRFFKEMKDIAIIFFIIFVLRSSFINWYEIPTGSMMPTLKIGDHVVVNKLEYGFMLPFMRSQIVNWNSIKKGDIVVFRDPEEKTIWGTIMPRNLIKRVVGVEGDRVQFLNGVLSINYTPVNEELILDRTTLDDLNIDDKISLDRNELIIESGASEKPHYILRQRYGGRTNFETREWKIPKGKLLVLGDNRDNSYDGRFFGYINKNHIYGRAFLITYSIIKWDYIIPKFRKGRWFLTLTH